LVGIPLGAIIKKGGFGISIVMGIIIFVSYYILSMLGKNAAEEGAISPYLGAWFATSVLLPLGLYLTYKAHNDSEFAKISNLIEVIKSAINKKYKKQKSS
jgi:lipopolysaccharide export system permease protein